MQLSFYALYQRCQASHALFDLLWGEGAEGEAHEARAEIGDIFALVEWVGEEVVTVGQGESGGLGAG